MNFQDYKYQQKMKRVMAQALDPPGFRPFPQHKHRLAAMIIIWLTKRQKNAPSPYLVATLSESYRQYL